MAYDRDLADRLREHLASEHGVSEKAMFGGLAFLIDGRMALAAVGRGGLMVRVDPTDTDTLVERPGAARFTMRGRELDGWLLVEGDVLTSDGSLADWAGRGVAFVRTLPSG